MAGPQIPLDLIDPDSQKVIRRLTRNGYEAYLVGGCVRDLLVGRTPKDFDVATSATPAEIRDVFRNCRIIGRRFRLAHIFFGTKIIETATFRANPREVLGPAEEDAPGGGGTDEDGDLLIQRDNVFGTAEEDARRRDFTINGLFYDLEESRVIDYVGGLSDLDKRSVRTIGDPGIRFREDPVRMLRAIKFAARLGFDVEDRTYRALITHPEEIGKSAAPRVMEEIYRLLRGGAAMESVVLLGETGLLRALLPELDTLLQQNPAALDPYLGALDKLVRIGDVPQNSVLLCALCAPKLLPLLDDKESERLRDPAALVEEALAPLIDRLRIARRDVEQTRQVLLAQRRLWQLERRGGKPGTVAQREWFADAMQVHGMVLLSRGAPEDRVAKMLEGARRPREGRLGVAPLPYPGSASTVSELLDEGGPGGRRRRPRRPPQDSRAAALASVASDDEPLEGEEEALSAFAAAMSRGGEPD